MKGYSKVVAVLMLLVFAVASGPATARGGHGGGGHGGGGGRGGGYSHGYGYRGSVGVGVAIGVPLYGLGYYPGYNPYPYAYLGPDYAYPAPDYSYPAPAVAPSPGYAQQGYPQAAQAPAQPQGDWYFCPASNAYYPYLRECPSGWQRVPAQPQR